MRYIVRAFLYPLEDSQVHKTMEHGWINSLMHLLSNLCIILLLSHMMWDLLAKSRLLWIANESLEDALKQLCIIDAIDENGSITSVGRTRAGTFIPLVNCCLLTLWVLRSNGLFFSRKMSLQFFQRALNQSFLFSYSC